MEKAQSMHCLDLLIVSMILSDPVPSRPLPPITMMSNTCTIKYRFTMTNQMVRLPEMLLRLDYRFYNSWGCITADYQWLKVHIFAVSPPA